MTIDTADQALDAYFASGDDLTQPAAGQTEYHEEIGGWVLHNIRGVVAVVMDDGTVVDPVYDDEEGWVVPRDLRERRAEQTEAELERAAAALDGAAASAELAAEVIRRLDGWGTGRHGLGLGTEFTIRAAPHDLRHAAEVVRERADALREGE